jgi:DNA-binding SARP family transcriptional activator
MELRLLGPVDAWHGGVRLGLGPRKQRFCLAVLALEANHLVRTDRLVDLTWPAAPPRTARHAIAVNVSGLRRILGAARGTSAAELVTHGAGYMLRTDPLSIDVHRFRWLVDAAARASRHLDRLDLLRRALTLWRGPALVDAGAPDVINRLTQHLTEERLAAEEQLAETELRAGNHLGIVARLVDLVAAHPYRQGLVALLMLAQYRSGLIGDALASYRTARTTMAAEVGLDPGPRLRRLEGAILRGDPQLDAPDLTW